MFGLTPRRPRPARPQTVQAVETIDDRYSTALLLWADQHGANRMDLTPEQEGRFRALEAASGDATTARRLVFGRLLTREGVLCG